LEITGFVDGDVFDILCGGWKLEADVHFSFGTIKGVVYGRNGCYYGTISPNLCITKGLDIQGKIVINGAVRENFNGDFVRYTASGS